MSGIYRPLGALTDDINYLMDDILQQSIIAMDHASLDYLQGLLNWLCKFSCLILHSAISEYPFREKFRYLQRRSKHFESKVKQAKEMNITPKILHNNGKCNTYIDRILEDMEEVIRFITNEMKGPFAHKGYLTHTLDLAKTVIQFECQLVHSKIAVAADTEKFEKLIAILCLRIFQLTNIKYDKALTPYITFEAIVHSQNA